MHLNEEKLALYNTVKDFAKNEADNEHTKNGVELVKRHSSKEVFGDHPSCFLALLESPHNTSISAGLMNLSSCTT